MTHHPHVENPQEKAAKIEYFLRLYRQQADHVSKNLQLLADTLMDMERSMVALDAVGKNTLTSIGGGVWVYAQMNTDAVLVDIGAGYFLEKSIPEAKALLARRKEKLQETQRALETELVKLLQSISALEQDLDRTLAEIQHVRSPEK